MKSEKSFDAMRTMRQIRDKISGEIKRMSVEGQRRYIKERVNIKFEEAEKVVNDVQAA